MKEEIWFSASTGKAISEYVSESLVEEVAFVAEEVSDLKDVELGLVSSVGDLVGTDSRSGDPVASVSYALNVAAFAVFYATILSSNVSTEELKKHVSVPLQKADFLRSLDGEDGSEDLEPEEDAEDMSDSAFFDARGTSIRTGDIVRVSEEYEPERYRDVFKVVGFKGKAVVVEGQNILVEDGYFAPYNLIVMDFRGILDRSPEQHGREEAVDHPEHYGGEENPYEAIKVIEAWEANFNVGNALKYLSRYQLKGGDEDLRKAVWYINREAGVR